jgi:hypothetical protein
MLNANEIFSAHFNKIARELPFDSAWNNGTGYFDALVTADIADLEVGEMAKSYTGDVNRRRIIIMKTVLGNVVVFDRYTDNATLEYPVFTQNSPRAIERAQLVKSGQINGGQMEALLGDADYPDCTRSLARRLMSLQAAFDKATTAVVA